MLSTLVSLGPWEWTAVFGIAAVLIAAILLWRKVEPVLGEEPMPMNLLWFFSTAIMVTVASVGILLLVNKFAPVHIRSYGVMLLIGFTSGLIYCSKVGPSRGLTVPMAIDMLLMDLIFAIVGARGIFILTMLKDYKDNPASMVDVWQGGLSFHGGVIGGIIATAIFCHWRKVRFVVLGDIMAPALCIGYAITRIGCFLNGCCHGHATNLPWGVYFPENAAEFPMHVHPTQLYAAAGSVVLFFILTRLWPKMHRPGQLFPLYLMLYSLLRFGCEQTRRGATAELFGPFPAVTIGQAACILIAIAGLIWFLILQKLPYENPVTARATALAPAPAEVSATKKSDKSGKQKRKSAH